MGKKKVGHATWFKLSLQHEAVLTAVSDECAGRVIKHALRYLSHGQVPDSMDPLESVVFASLRQSVDEANDSYTRSSKAGQKGNSVRWSAQVSGGIGGRAQVSGGIGWYPEIDEDTDVSSSTTKNIAAVPGLEAGGQQEDFAEMEARLWREVEGL